MSINIGDWVEDTVHGYRGQVTAIHARCPESDGWVARQSPAIAIEHVRGHWVSFLVDGGGSVTRPVALVEVIEAPGQLDNLWAEHYFGPQLCDTPLS